MPTVITIMTNIIMAISTAQSDASNPSSVEALKAASTRMFIATVCWGIIAAVITALCTWQLWRSNRAYQDVVKADANARIEESKTLGAIATAEAAKANEGLAKSNEEIARLTAETEQAKLERAEADKQIAVAKANAANATQRTAEVSLKVEEEARKRAEAERALLELQQQIAQRAFSDTQEVALIQALGTLKARIPVTCPEVSEPGIFGAQIGRILSKANWNTSLGTASPSWEGLILTVEDLSNPPPSAVLLVSEFAKAGIVVTMTGRDGAPKIRTLSGSINLLGGDNKNKLDVLNLWVGENPKPRRTQ